MMLVREYESVTERMAEGDSSEELMEQFHDLTDQMEKRKCLGSGKPYKISADRIETGELSCPDEQPSPAVW